MTIPDTTRPGLLASVWLAALLTAVVVGLGVVVGFKALDAVDSRRALQVETGQILGDDERTELLVQAADLSELVLTYHHDSFRQDVEVAAARLTPEFGKEYARTMEQVRANTARNKISQQATAVSTAIISATSQEAQVLVFINQETSSARTRAEKLVRNTLVVDLVRVDSNWAIAGVNALG